MVTIRVPRTDGRDVALGWQSWCMVGDPLVHRLDVEWFYTGLAHLGQLGHQVVEPLVAALPELASLGVVRHRLRTDTALGRATSICQVVREAAERLEDDPEHPGPVGQRSPVAQAQMLLRVHYATKALSAADARTKTQEASGVGGGERLCRVVNPEQH